MSIFISIYYASFLLNIFISIFHYSDDTQDLDGKATSINSQTTVSRFSLFHDSTNFSIYICQDKQYSDCKSMSKITIGKMENPITCEYLESKIIAALPAVYCKVTDDESPGEKFEAVIVSR